MKSQKGITLASLAIYIILILIVLAILATVTANFQSSIKQTNREGTEIAEINKFNMYFLQEVKKQGNNIIAINENDENNITFSSKNKYVFNNNSIRLIKLDENNQEVKNIEIAKDIKKCTFERTSENGKDIIKVVIGANNTDEVTQEYVLNTEEITPIYEDEKEYVYSSNKENEIENNI